MDIRIFLHKSFNHTVCLHKAYVLHFTNSNCKFTFFKNQHLQEIMCVILINLLQNMKVFPQSIQTIHLWTDKNENQVVQLQKSLPIHTFGYSEKADIWPLIKNHSNTDLIVNLIENKLEKSNKMKSKKATNSKITQAGECKTPTRPQQMFR